MQYAIISILVSVLIFLILREFFCWYFKINKRISLMEELISEIKKMNKEDTEDEKKKIWLEKRINTLIREGLLINDAKIKAISDYSSLNNNITKK